MTGGGQSLNVRLALLLSVLPLLPRAVAYLRLGSYLPAMAFALLALPALWGMMSDHRLALPAVRAWCAAMIVWGSARLLLFGATAVTDLSDEAHVMSQMTPLFAAISVVYLLTGLLTWRNARRPCRG